MPATARPTQAHSHAGGPASAKPKLYNPRYPEAAHCCTKPSPSTSRLGMNLPAPASSTARATTPPPSPMSATLSASTSNAASSPTALPEPGAMTAGTTTSWPIPAKAGASAPRAIRLRCGDGGAPDGPCFPPPAGAPMGTVRPEAAALLHAARRGGTGYGAAHLPAGHFALPADPQPLCGTGRQGSPAHRGHRLYPPIRLQPEPSQKAALPKLCGAMRAAFSRNSILLTLRTCRAKRCALFFLPEVANQPDS
jgi:hypothetical protein